MPSTSKKQAHLMAAVAHNPAFAKKVGIPQSVGKDFNSADKGKTFKKGGDIVGKLFKGKESMKEELAEAKAIKSGKITPMQYAKGEESEKKMAKGGMAESMGPRTMSKDVESGANKLTKFGQSAVQKRGMTKGTNLGDSGKTVGIQKMAKGGKVKRYSGEDGESEVDNAPYKSDDQGVGPAPLRESALFSKTGKNENIGDDTRARAMAAVAKGNAEETPAPKAVSKPAPKAAPKAETPAATPKATPVQQAKDVVSGKGASVPKSFSDAGGNTKASSSKADISSLGFKKPSDPLARFEQAGPKRSEQNMPAKKKSSSSSDDYSVGNAMRKGGKVGPSRGDGIAQRGRTKGKYL